MHAQLLVCWPIVGDDVGACMRVTNDTCDAELQFSFGITQNTHARVCVCGSIWAAVATQPGVIAENIECLRAQGLAAAQHIKGLEATQHIKGLEATQHIKG